MRVIPLILFFLLMALVAGFFVSQQPSHILILSVAVPVVFVAVFVNPGLGLYILIFSMLLSPEIQIGETRGSTLGRGVTLRFEDFLLMVIAGSWFFRNAVYKDLGLFLKTPLNRPILFYVLACVLATGFGIMAGRVPPKTGSLFVLKYIEYFIVFYMVVNHVRTDAQIKRFVFCLFLTCFIVSVIGITQIPGGGRISAPFEGEQGEPNTFGGYLVFLLAIAVGLFYHIEDFRIRKYLIILMAVILPPLLFTESRASYLALIPMMFVLGVMMEKRAIIIGVMAAALIVSPLFLPATVINRVLFTIHQPEEPGQIQIGEVRLDTSLSARVQSWRQALAAWPQKPVFGYGVTGWRFMDAQFPRVLVETGIVGLLAFLLLLVSIFRMAADHYRQVTTPFAKGICMGYIAGFVGLLFHSLGANTFIIVRIMEPFWFVTGIVFVLPMLEMATGRDNPSVSDAGISG